MKKNSLSDDELIRYDRQLLISKWDEKVQLKLKNSKVLVVGAGGLGSTVLLFLTAVGIGNLTIIDNDKLELSNLNRQILYNTNEINNWKVLAARERLTALNPKIEINPLNITLNDDNVNELLSGMDLIVDCLDNFETRFIINEFSIKNKIPFVHAAIRGLEGRVMFIDPNDEESPCLRCFYPENIENIPKKKKFPVLGSIVGATASIEATEAIKYLVGIGKNLIGRFLIIDGKLMEFNTIVIKRNPKCPICGSTSS